jgi:hypothetical protein
MTGEMIEGSEAFRKSTFECVEDLNRLLPGLSLRYDTEVIIGAMAEHVGAAIWALRQKKLCDTRQARLAIEHLEHAAFRAESKPPSASAP